MSDSVFEFLKDKAARNGDRRLLHFEGRDVSYRELDLLTNRMANGLKDRGIGPGDKVCIMMANSLEFIYAWLGLVKIGAVEVPINTAHKGDLLSYLINNSDARFMIVDAHYLGTIAKIESGLTKLEKLVVWQEEQTERPIFQRLKLLAFENLLVKNETLRGIDLHGPDDFCILYTSGTTGPSKGVVLPHKYVINLSISNANQLGYSENDVLYACLPLFHGNAQLMSILAAMAANASVVLVRRFSVSRFWEEIDEYGATATNLPGSVISMLLKQDPSEKDVHHSLRKVFTAGTPRTAWEEFELRFKVQIYEGYGSTECGMILMNTVTDRKIGTIGKPSKGYQVTIVDEEDNQLLTGQVGEIVTRPEEPYCMMKWYYKQPDKTLEAYQNLWFHSGDYGYQDEEGYFYFVDRKKDVIRRRGENISSFEVERSVNTHPKVLESAAVAVPDPLGEYELKVVVVAKLNANLTPEELIVHCEERMASFMVPRYIELRDSLPKTPTDRVEKYKLRQEGVNDKTWDRLKG